MAQPGPFHDPTAQQRQRPGHFQSSPGFNYAANPGASAGVPFHAQSQVPPAPKPMYPTQRQPQPQRGPAHQFYQKPAAPAQPAPGSQDGFFNPQSAPGYAPEFQQPTAGAPSAQQFQHRHPAPATAPSNSFGYGQTPQQSPPGSNPHSQQQQPDFINQFASNPMAGMAMNQAQDFLHKQSALYLPGAYGIWGSLKYYFTVNNSYVKSRLKMLLLPFRHKNWRRIGANEQDDGKAMQYAPPSRDCNAPDLYLPLMGFLTYILIVGYSKGTSGQFSPDVIVNDASYCVVMQLVEIAVLAACLYVLNSSISFLDLVSFSGYKYIPLVINTLVFQLLGSVAYYVTLLYTGTAVSYFTLNCMKGSVAEPTPENRIFRNYLLFGVSCLQLVLVCWISYTTAPGEE